MEGPEARLFFEVFHGSDTIGGMDHPMLLDGSGRHEVSITYPAIQEFSTRATPSGWRLALSILGISIPASQRA